MTSAAGLAVSAVLTYLPLGYELDYDSWPGGDRETLMIELTARDGSGLEVPLIVGRATRPQDIKDLLVFGLSDEAFVFRTGEKNKVLIFGPRGASMKSITIKSAVWKNPKYRVVLRQR